MEIGFFYALATAVTWGLVYTLDQKILYTIDPMTFLFVHSLLAAIFMLPFVFFSHGSIREVFLSGKANLALIVATVALATLSNFFIFSGIKHLDASTVSMIEISYPFFVVFFIYLIFRSTPNPYFFLGGFLVFIGSYIIIRFA